MTLSASLKKQLLTVSKIAVSALFIVILVRTVPLGEVVQLFARLNLWYVLVLLLLSYLMVVESCLKWQLLLRRKNISIGLHQLVKLYVLGYFFNNFLPSMVGGDSARGLILGKRCQRLGDVFLSIFMERFTGFLALIFLTATTVLIDHPLVRIGNLRSIMFLVLLAALGLIVLVFSRRFFGWLMSLLPGEVGRLREKIIGLQASLQDFRQHKLEFALVLLLSLLFHLMTGLNLYYGCLALNYTPDLIDMLVVTPFIVLLSLLPITINGIGLWESSFVLFFSLLGIPSTLALSVALLLRLKTLAISAVGGYFYLQEGSAGQELLRRPTD